MWKGKVIFILNKTDSSHSHPFSWISLSHILVFPCSQPPRCVYLWFGQDPLYEHGGQVMAGIKTLLHLLCFSWLLTINWVLDWLFNPFRSRTVIAQSFAYFNLYHSEARLWSTVTFSSFWVSVWVQSVFYVAIFLFSDWRLPADNSSVLWPYWNITLLVFLKKPKS